MNISSNTAKIHGIRNLEVFLGVIFGRLFRGTFPFWKNVNSWRNRNNTGGFLKRFFGGILCKIPGWTIWKIPGKSLGRISEEVLKGYFEGFLKEYLKIF